MPGETMSERFVLRDRGDGTLWAYCTWCENGNGPTVESLMKACARSYMCRTIQEPPDVVDREQPVTEDEHDG